ncbi:hypothetical protein HK098_005318 [Nowakowskiella sp. JEL0407]|nr:hypothetical protein HK098_005318 [Nowakowskiella sp. JEL0407]
MNFTSTRTEGITHMRSRIKRKLAHPKPPQKIQSELPQPEFKVSPQYPQIPSKLAYPLASKELSAIINPLIQGRKSRIPIDDMDDDEPIFRTQKSFSFPHDIEEAFFVKRHRELKITNSEVKSLQNTKEEITSLKTEPQLDFSTVLRKAEEFVESQIHPQISAKELISSLTQKKRIYSPDHKTEAFDHFLPVMTPMFVMPVEEKVIDDLIERISQRQATATNASNEVAPETPAEATADTTTAKKKKKNKKKKKKGNKTDAPQNQATTKEDDKEKAATSTEVPVKIDPPTPQKPAIYTETSPNTSATEHIKQLSIRVADNLQEHTPAPTPAISSPKSIDDQNSPRQDSKMDVLEQQRQESTEVVPPSSSTRKITISIPSLIPPLFYPTIIKNFLEKGMKILSLARRFESGWTNRLNIHGMAAKQQLLRSRADNSKCLMVKCELPLGLDELKMWEDVKNVLVGECLDEDWLKKFVQDCNITVSDFGGKIGDDIPDRVLAIQRISTPRTYTFPPLELPHCIFITAPTSKISPLLHHITPLSFPGHFNSGSMQYKTQRPLELSYDADPKKRQTELVAIKYRSSSFMRSDETLLRILNPNEVGSAKYPKWSTNIKSVSDEDGWVCCVVYGIGVEEKIEEFVNENVKNKDEKDLYVFTQNAEMYFNAVSLIFRDVDISGVYCEDDFKDERYISRELVKGTVPWSVTNAGYVVPSIVAISERSFSKLSEIWEILSNMNGTSIVGAKLTHGYPHLRENEKLILDGWTGMRGAVLWVALMGVQADSVRDLLRNYDGIRCAKSEATWYTIKVVFEEIGRVSAEIPTNGKVKLYVQAPEKYDFAHQARGNLTGNCIHIDPEIKINGELSLSNWSSHITNMLKTHGVFNVGLRMCWRRFNLAEYPVLELWVKGDMPKIRERHRS